MLRLLAVDRRIVLILTGVIACADAPQGKAQSFDAGVEATTDEVRRGLSWSEGRVSASADVHAGFAGLDVGLRLALLRGSDRHANADLVADLTLGKDWNAGLVTVRTEVVGHIFAGADSAMNYGEVGVGARYGIGPLQLGAMAWYAPKQDAIGGDNLHLRATAEAGLPGLPVAVFAAVGHTTGDSRDSFSARLRPAGDYTDWKIGAEFTRYPLTLGVDYVGTDIDTANMISISPFADLQHASDRVVARLRLSF